MTMGFGEVAIPPNPIRNLPPSMNNQATMTQVLSCPSLYISKYIVLLLQADDLPSPVVADHNAPSSTATTPPWHYCLHPGLSHFCSDLFLSPS